MLEMPFSGSRGACTSDDETINQYISVNKTNKDAVTTNIPDANKMDGCTAKQYECGSGQSGSRVMFIKIIKGSHTLPGGALYLPKLVVGKVAEDSIQI